MEMFDPLSYENLGGSIVRALNEQPLLPLNQVKSFDGAGIYALYYTGSFPAYQILSQQNQKWPGSQAIYVGKAEAENARKGDLDQVLKPVGTKLFNRIMDHKRSIELAKNLAVEDFQVRALPVVATWVPLAEVVAIRLNAPVWNTVVDGLGNHNPGRGRAAGMRPRWDTLHPGRPWADRLADRPNTEDIAQDVVHYLSLRKS